MKIELTAAEAEILREILQEQHRHLQVETRRTDSLSYRRDLQYRHDLLEALLARLSPVGVEEPGA